MKRHFNYITVGKILEELWEDAQKVLPKEQLWYVNKKGDEVKRWPIDRVKFYRVEAKLGLPKPHRTETESPDHQWRIYSRKEAEALKDELKRRFSHKFQRA